MGEDRSFQKGILWFLCGCAVAAVPLGLYTMSLKNQLQSTENVLRQLQISRQSNAQVDGQTQAKLQSIQSQFQDVTQQRDSIQSQLQAVTQQRDTCQSKFNRGTFLYEQPILGGPTREWLLPVDVEPVYVGNRRGIFSHYDPKTQVETVKFDAKTK